MRNKMPSGGPRFEERGIVNLDNASDPGTHWVAYKKHGSTVVYFDSYGNLKPPLELQRYFKNCKLFIILICFKPNPIIVAICVLNFYQNKYMWKSVCCFIVFVSQFAPAPCSDSHVSRCIAHASGLCTFTESSFCMREKSRGWVHVHLDAV